MAEKLGNLTIEDARIMFRNFTGREGQYNAEGDRNFCLVLPDHLIEPMTADGWNIKYTKVREEGDVPTPYIQVSVNYGKGRPPRCVMITSRGRTDIPEDMIEMLDYADIAKIDLTINPYVWGPIGGKSGVKAYLKTFFVTIQEDELDKKYADVPETRELERAPRPLAIESGSSDDDIIDVESWDED